MRHQAEIWLYDKQLLSEAGYTEEDVMMIPPQDLEKIVHDLEIENQIKILEKRIEGLEEKLREALENQPSYF